MRIFGVDYVPTWHRGRGLVRLGLVGLGNGGLEAIAAGVHVVADTLFAPSAEIAQEMTDDQLMRPTAPMSGSMLSSRAAAGSALSRTVGSDLRICEGRRRHRGGHRSPAAD